MRIDRTAAKIGRSMKKCEKFIYLTLARTAGKGHLAASIVGEGSLRRRLRLDRAGVRRDLGARPGAHQPLDDDPIVRRQAAPDDPQAVMAGGPPDHPPPDRGRAP